MEGEEDKEHIPQESTEQPNQETPVSDESEVPESIPASDDSEAPTEEAPTEDNSEAPTEEAPTEDNEPDQRTRKPTTDSETVHPSSPNDLVPGSDAIKDDSTATVRIVLMPTGQMVTLTSPRNLPLQEITAQFAKEFQMPTDFIHLTFDSLKVTETSTLADLGVEPNATVQLELKSTCPESHPIRQFRRETEYRMPRFTSVRVTLENGIHRYVQVEILQRQYRKPFLGGYRHKLNGKEFHNVFMQTPWFPECTQTLDNASHRDTQTYQQRHQRQQTFNDMATQMTGVGVYIANMEDKLVEPGPYTTAEEHAAMILEKVIILQKNYRRWLAVRKVARLKEAKRKRLQWEEEEELRKLMEREEMLRLEFERKLHPRTPEDFDFLYAALEKWRLEELEKLNCSLSGAERKAALYMLLEKETDLLAAIDRHKMEAGIEGVELCIHNFLYKTAAPKKFRGFDDKQTMMVTPFTIRAKELRDIYISLNMKYLTPDERLDILLTLKYTVMEHKCALTTDIMELVDREADLLMRGVKDDNLMGLRKRISTLFLQYTKTPTFNPEAANFLQVPQNPLKLRKNIFYCPSCNKYLSSAEFSMHTNMRTSGHCRRCIRLDNIARPRLDLSHFRRMLEGLRLSEEKYKDGSHFAFIMQETDIRYLVEYIWNGQSILSSWKDPHDLVLARWDKKVHWSPWNCILLTTEEAESHEKVDNLNVVYGEVFQKKLNQKHTFAWDYFNQLPRISRLLIESTLRPSTHPKPQRPGTANKPTQMPQPTLHLETRWSKQPSDLQDINQEEM